MNWGSIRKFLREAFSENGVPSSSRILSAWLSFSSMALIWFIVRHAFYIDDREKLITWVGGIPAIVYALAAFAVSPYGLTKLTGMWRRKDDDKDDADKASETQAKIEEKVEKVVEKVEEKVGKKGRKG